MALRSRAPRALPRPLRPRPSPAHFSTATAAPHPLPTTHFSAEPFGEFSTPLRSSAVGTPITLYTLANSAFIESGGRAGLCASVTDLGATVQSILVPDREGRLADVALGFDSGQEYLAPQPYVGCTVGRVANRIGGGRFSLGGEEYELEQNMPFPECACCSEPAVAVHL